MKMSDLTGSNRQVDENEFKQSLIDSGYSMVEPYAFLLKYGSIFTETAPLPTGVRRRAKNCYANSGRLASRLPDRYFYCEGLAVSEFGPIDHAWCVDSQRRVVEVTWKAPGHVYFGVVFRQKYLDQPALQSHIWGGYVAELAKRVRDNGISAYEGIFLDGVPQ
jgi:hypothetical protein